MAFKYAVALTGSIATGKSVVAKVFNTLGMKIIDADTIAHKILDVQHDKIAKMFGSALVSDGKVDRKALGKIIFSDTKERKRLESLLHPLIYKEITTLSEALDQLKKPYLIDIPLFFETKRYPIESALVVYTPTALQRTRLMQRDNSSQEEAQQRMDTQIDIESKVKYATYVIDNSGTLSELEDACKRVYKKIVGDFR
jgi:dephospho-CoA kinase